MSIVTRGLLINGEDVAAADGRTTDDVSPWSGNVYARVAAAGPDDVTRAIDAAEAVFPGWSAMGPYERRKIFLRAADIMEARQEEAIAIMASEVGGARPWASFNAELCTEILREAGAAVTQPTGQVLATNMAGTFSYAMRVPYGVVAAISPWNAPYILGIRSIAIPIAMGNTVVMKPSEDAPVACGLFLADVLHEAGLPVGVLNVVTNDLKDAGTIVETLISDRRVRLVNFTGSTEVGRVIGTTAAQHLKPAILELGGKNALIVLENANIDYAVAATRFACYMNSGQVCMSTDRVIVLRKIADIYIEKLATALDGLPYGDPADSSTVVGPVVNTRAASRIAALVGDAVSKGAKLLYGTGEVEGIGKALLKPLLLGDVTREMHIYYGEIFGPAATVHIVDTVDEAVDLANDTDYGLTGGVISENFKEAVDVARRMRTGIVHINHQGIADEPMAPFGGVKDTGYGRFGGQAGIEAFSQLRWVTVQERGYPKY